MTGKDYHNVRSAGEVIQALCHGASVAGGWWHDPITGEDIRQDPEKLLAVCGWKLSLIHSEVSEATEGLRKGKMDDHLPHRKMVEVELADAVVRIGDLAGALGLDLGGALVEKMQYNETRADHKPANRAKSGGKRY